MYAINADFSVILNAGGGGPESSGSAVDCFVDTFSSC